MLFKKKWLNVKKKVILALFLKNQFFVDFRIFENFLGSRYHRIFYSPFSYQSGPKLLIYAKKNIINHFRRIAWTLSYRNHWVLPTCTFPRNPEKCAWTKNVLFSSSALLDQRSLQLIGINYINCKNRWSKPCALSIIA